LPVYTVPDSRPASYSPRRLPSDVAQKSTTSSAYVRIFNRLLTSMSDFGDNLPASTVVYALAVIYVFWWASVARA